MKLRLSFLLFLGLCLPIWNALTPLASAQDSKVQPPVESPAASERVTGAAGSEGEEAIHNELRVLREALVEALASGDIEKQLTYADEDIVTTWQNNRTTHGIDELKAFLHEFNPQGAKAFQGYKKPPETDRLSIIFDGDTAIASGSSVPSYKLVGMEFDLQNRWTATLIKKDGKWLIASYHVSANVLDNPLLSAAKQSTYIVGGVCLIIGLLIGGVIIWFMKRKSA